MRLLPPEVLPEAQRRAWSRRHPVRASLGHTLLVTPIVAVFVILAPDLAWTTRLVDLVAAAVLTFGVSWLAIRRGWATRDRRSAAPPNG
jgi:hypothetical protein